MAVSWNKVDAKVIGVGKCRGISDIAFSGAQEVSVSIFAFPAVCEAENVCRQKLRPTLFTWFAFADFGYLLEALVDSVDEDILKS